jgi:site-specific DNA-methyltransferase (adenine-specific)
MTEFINQILQGDVLERIKEIPDNSINSVVTDPPYELGFMGKSWDATGIAYNPTMWKECLRVLKSGGHLLSFGGSRTYHRMACAIEDAGFEIRDQIMWVYGSGFPKSLNIGKVVDKLQGNKREIVRRNPNSRENCDKTNTLYESGTVGKTDYISKGNSPYEGWGTALKPAHEPIVVARKPISEKNIAENVLKYGTGGINIDGCRVETQDNLNGGGYNTNGTSKKDLTNATSYATKVMDKEFIQPSGRFPANFIHDGSDEVVRLFPETKSGKPSGVRHKSNHNVAYADIAEGSELTGFGDFGSAARFFYTAKASKSERNMGLEGFEERKYQGRWNNAGEWKDGENMLGKNHHPTVKPISLMSYLCRLVTPKGGIVLDPFMGSGTTGIAAKIEGFNFIGIEKEEGYVKIAEARIKSVPKTLF